MAGSCSSIPVPTAELEVFDADGDGGTWARLRTSDVDMLVGVHGSDQGMISVQSAHNLVFRTNAIERMKINWDGGLVVGASGQSVTVGLEVINAGVTNGTGATIEVTSGSSPGLIVSQGGTGRIITGIGRSGIGLKEMFIVHNNGDVDARGTFTSDNIDLAEVFETEGPTSDYEAGDVLVISESKDHAVRKSSTPYSRLVAGVQATKPGVLLGKSVEGETIPMGVVGVIPTKVTVSNGSIRRGDLLVSSAIQGHAMKADLKKVGVGMVIGKALENFDGPTEGVIKVLVNVK